MEKRYIKAVEQNGVWRLEFNGVVLGDQRGFESRRAALESVANRHGKVDGEYPKNYQGEGAAPWIEFVWEVEQIAAPHVSDWKTEFADFDAMPDIPADWVDSSWHNDLCPSFTVMQGGEGDSNYEFARVWVDYENPELRDIPGATRFQVSFENGESDFHIGIASDDWAEILAYVEIRRALGAAYVGVVGYNPFLDCPDIKPADVAENLLYQYAARHGLDLKSADEMQIDQMVDAIDQRDESTRAHIAWLGEFVAMWEKVESNAE
ncbi:hypothetical protein RCCWILLIS_1 [Rhodobacter phage RcCWillis]|nr:hypothetical protein RCCWILLIS_1 [Rhodobacter phage RcCWillis]